MSRPKADPIDRALDAYAVLTAPEREVFQAVVKRLPADQVQKPRRRQKLVADEPAPSLNATEAAKGE